MKKLIIILMMMLLLVTSSCSLINIAQRNSMRVYNTDYTEKYKHTLNAMFDYEWTIISVEERFVAAIKENCKGVEGRDEQFIEWIIEYQNGNGDARHFRFTNRSPFALQVAIHVERYILEYYREHFFDVHMSDVPLEPSSRVSGGIVRAGVNRHLRENQEWVRAADEYRNLLDTPEGTIRLSQLTPANAFEMVPISLSIGVSISRDYNLEQPVEEVISKVENMIDDMNRFTNNQLTAVVSISHAGNQIYRWYYIQGERVYNISDRWLFDRYIFESFRGVFW